VALCVLAGCIGPNLISTRDDENGRGGIVSFHGRENIGYVDARVMQERTDDAIQLARDWCDGGVVVSDKHAEGGENFIDFKCTVLASAAPAARPCVEPSASPPPAAEQAAPAPAAVESGEPAEAPPAEPPPPKKKKRRGTDR
jgi:hypothetical protein